MCEKDFNLIFVLYRNKPFDFFLGSSRSSSESGGLERSESFFTQESISVNI